MQSFNFLALCLYLGGQLAQPGVWLRRRGLPARQPHHLSKHGLQTAVAQMARARLAVVERHQLKAQRPPGRQVVHGLMAPAGARGRDTGLFAFVAENTEQS